MSVSRYIEWTLESSDVAYRPLGYRIELGDDRFISSPTHIRETFQGSQNFFYDTSGTGNSFIAFPQDGIWDAEAGTLIRFVCHPERVARNLVIAYNNTLHKIAADSSSILSSTQMGSLSPLTMDVDTHTNTIWILDSDKSIYQLTQDLELKVSNTQPLVAGNDTKRIVVDGSRYSFWEIAPSSVTLRSFNGSTLNTMAVSNVEIIIASHIDRHTGTLFFAKGTTSLLSSVQTIYRIARDGTVSSINMAGLTYVQDISGWDLDEILYVTDAGAVNRLDASMSSSLLHNLASILPSKITSIYGEHYYVYSKDNEKMHKINESTGSEIWWRDMSLTANAEVVDIDARFGPNEYGREIVFWSDDVVGTIVDYETEGSLENKIEFESSDIALGIQLSDSATRIIYAKYTPISSRTLSIAGESSSSSSSTLAMSTSSELLTTSSSLSITSDVSIAWIQQVLEPYDAYLAAYWNMDETSGTRLDSKGSNHLTEFTDIVAGESSKINFGAKISQTTSPNPEDYLEAPNHVSLIPASGLAISGWIKNNQFSGTPSTMQIIFKVGTGQNYRVFYSNPAWYFNFTDDATGLGVQARMDFASIPNGDNNWHHFVALATSGVSEIYIDGVMGNAVGSYSSIRKPLDELKVGYNNQNPFVIDELALWGDLIIATSEERQSFVDALYNDGEGVTYSDGVWTFPESSSLSTQSVSSSSQTLSTSSTSSTSSAITAYTVSATSCLYFHWSYSGSNVELDIVDNHRPVAIPVPEWASHAVIYTGSDLWGMHSTLLSDASGLDPGLIAPIETDASYSTSALNSSTIDRPAFRRNSLIGMWDDGSTETPISVGEHNVFGIGTSETVSIPSNAAWLVLGMHEFDNWSDNVGSQTVTIEWLALSSSSSASSSSVSSSSVSSASTSSTSSSITESSSSMTNSTSSSETSSLSSVSSASSASSSSTSSVSSSSSSSAPPTSGLVLWLDANNADSFTLDGSDIVQWNDLSGTGNHLTQADAARRPQRITGSVNGMAAVRIANNSVSRESPTSIPLGASDRSMFIVIKTPSAFGNNTSQQNVFFGYADWAYTDNKCFAYAIVDLYGYDNMTLWGCNHDADFGSQDPSTVYIWSTLYTSGQLDAYRNGVSTYSLPEPDFESVADFIRVGGFLSDIDSPTIPPSFVCEVLLYDRVVSPTERAAIENYLTRWQG